MLAIRLSCVSLGTLLCIASTAATFTCPTLFNFYPDASDCTKFYRCTWGKGYSFNCPAGTRWSQSLLTCDHADNVPCHKYPVTHTTIDPHTGLHIVQPVPEAQNPDFSVDQDGYASVHYSHPLENGHYSSGNYDYNQGKYKSESASHMSSGYDGKVNSHSEYSYGENYNSHSDGTNYHSTSGYEKYPNSHYAHGRNHHYKGDGHAHHGNNYAHGYNDYNNGAEYTTKSYYSDYSTPPNYHYNTVPYPSYQHYQISTVPSYPTPAHVNSQGSSYYDSYAYVYDNAPKYGRNNFYASYVNSDGVHAYGPLAVTEVYGEFPVRGHWPMSDIFRAGYGPKRIYHK